MSKTKQKGTALARRASGALSRLQSPPSPSSAGASIVEKLIELARDKNVDVVKIEKLIDANERVMKIGAKAAFDAAFAEMQAELPVITKDGKIRVNDKRTGELKRVQRFARLSDMQKVVRPILARHGFGTRFRHHFADGLLTVTGILTHAAGHAETDDFVTTRDDSGEKNVIQSWGSARRYGQRYVLISLLDIADESEDDDGNLAEAPAAGSSERRAIDADDAIPDRPPAKVKTPDVLPAEPKATPARDAHHKDELQPITERQLTRLWTIIRNSGRMENVVKSWLLTKYRVEHTKDISRRDYDAICEAIESPASLTL